MRDTFEMQLDSLDATIFSGDVLEDKENRECLKAHLARWYRGIEEKEREILEEVISDLQYANDWCEGSELEATVSLALGGLRELIELKDEDEI